MNNEPVKDGQEKEVHFLDYFIVIAKHSRRIIFVTAAVTVLAYIYFMLQPHRYVCTAKILPPQQNTTMIAQILEGLGGGGFSYSKELPSLFGGTAAKFFGGKSAVEMYEGMIRSNTVSDQIIKRFNLRKVFRAQNIEQARERLWNLVKTSTSKEGFIVIKVTDTDKQRVADIAAAFLEELDNLINGLSLREATVRMNFLEKVRHQSSIKLAKAEEALRTFSEKNKVLQIDTQTQNTLRYIAEMKAAIDTKEVQIQVLRQQATPSNYDVISLETELKGMKEKLRDIEAQCVPTPIGDVCLNTSKVPTLGLEYVRLFRELKFQEGLYQLYTKLSEIARLDMLRDVAVLQVIDKPQVPETRSNRRVGPALLVGVAAFFTMILLSFVHERVSEIKGQEEEYRRIEEIKKYLKPWVKGLRKFKDSA